LTVMKKTRRTTTSIRVMMATMPCPSRRQLCTRWLHLCPRSSSKRW
jgi:hypothetical protein